MTDTQGRYGTLRLISTKSGKAVSSFPVDGDVLTFGRDVSCDVRMYFVAVSSLHAKLVFEDSKPFLSVMGAGGVMLDGHQILPSAGSGEPTIVPLQDRSSFTIHNKIFRFDYPPANPTRPILATPQVAKPRRSLRMSMVNAALIMTPNTRVTPTSPSLETLQSPVKPFINEAKTRAEREQEVVLAEGDNVLVVKQGGDLVVTETLRDDEEGGSKDANNDDSAEEDGSLPSRGRSPQRTFPSHSSSAPGSAGSAAPISSNIPSPALSTPSRRSRSGSRFSLHKAVLVRNSQRALWDKNDEDEVTSVITAESDIGHPEISLDEEVEALEREQSNGVDVEIPHEDEYQDDEDGTPSNSKDVVDKEPNQNSEHEDEDEPMEDRTPPRRSLLLRASIEVISNALIAPFSRRWSGGETKPSEDDAEIAEDGQSEGATPDVNDADDVGPQQERGSERDGAPEGVPLVEAEDVPPSGDARSDPHSAEVEEFPSPAPSTREPPEFINAIPEPKGLSFRPFYTPQPRRTRTPLSGTGNQASSARSRRIRFSNFGLPDYIVNTTVADVDEEVDQVLDQEDKDSMSTPSLLPPVTPPRQISTNGLPNTETEPISTLESLRKLSRHLEIDNAKRANRLSFGLSPMRPQASPYRPSLGAAPSHPALEPIASQRNAEDIADTAEEDEESEESSDAEDGENLPPSPTKTPLRDPRASTPLRNLPIISNVALRTPSFTGFRNLFAQPTKPPSTPSFVGVRQLFRGDQPAEAPPTPSFTGVSDMFAPPEEDYAEEARDVTPKPLPRRFVTPAPSSTASSVTTGVVRGAGNLLAVPTRRSRSRSRSVANLAALPAPMDSVTETTQNAKPALARRSRSRSRSAAFRAAGEGAAGSRSPSRQTGLAREPTPKANSTSLPGKTGEAEELVPLPTRTSRSRSRCAASQPAGEEAAAPRAPSQQSRTEPPERELTHSESLPSKRSSSRGSATTGAHVSRSGRRRTPAVTSATPEPDTQDKNADLVATQPRRPRTPVAVEVTITTRSPKISPKISPLRARTTRSKRAHASDTEDGSITILPGATRPSEYRDGQIIPKGKTTEDAILVSSEEPTETEKSIENPSPKKPRKRARNVNSASPEMALERAIQISASSGRGTRLPVPSGRGRSVSRGGAVVGSTARRRAPPRNQNEEPGSEEEAPAVSSATRSNTRATASAPGTSNLLPTVVEMKGKGKIATPASEPARPTRVLRMRTAGKK